MLEKGLESWMAFCKPAPHCMQLVPVSFFFFLQPPEYVIVRKSLLNVFLVLSVPFFHSKPLSLGIFSGCSCGASSHHHRWSGHVIHNKWPQVYFPLNLHDFQSVYSWTAISQPFTHTHTDYINPTSICLNVSVVLAARRINWQTEFKQHCSAGTNI